MYRHVDGERHKYLKFEVAMGFRYRSSINENLFSYLPPKIYRNRLSVGKFSVI